MKQLGQTPSTFQYDLSMINGLTKSIDDDTEDVLEEAIFHAKEIYNEYLHDDNHRVKILAILEKLGQLDSGFTYNVCTDQNNVMTGFVWMTLAMRSNLHRFGSFLSLDAMRNKTNPYLWPYIGPCVVNELKKTVVICESFILEERTDAYIFVLNSMFEMAPSFNKKELKVICGDQFMTDRILQQTGLEHVKLFYDHYHLLNKYEIQLRHLYQNTKEYIKIIMNAESEKKIEEYIKSALHMFKKEAPIIEVINELSRKRDSFARYIIDATPGSGSQNGSTRSEQNHRSVRSYIDDGYIGEVEELFVFLINRQRSHATQQNAQLYEESQWLDIKRMKLIQENHHPMLIAATSSLNKWAYKDFFEQYRQLSSYSF